MRLGKENYQSLITELQCDKIEKEETVSGKVIIFVKIIILDYRMGILFG